VMLLMGHLTGDFNDCIVITWASNGQITVTVH
jgi:hypothetical protein